MFKHITEKIGSSISGKRIKNIANNINEYDRWFSFSEFEKSIRYCQNRIKKNNLKDVHIFQCPADGKTVLGDYLMPPAWDAISAELWIVKPKYAYKKISDYKKTPTSLFMYSAPTSPSGINAEVIILEGDYEKDKNLLKDVENKIVFISSRLSFQLKYQLIKKKALGIIDDWSEEFNQGKGVHWEGNRLYPNLEGKLFGFSLSKQTGLYLRDLIKKETQKGKKVQLFAKVKTHLYNGNIETLTGLIQGRDEKEEVLAFGHLFEVGAWDNASGVAVMLEISKVLHFLIETDKLQKPKRSIRFLTGFECFGLMSYLLSNPHKIPYTVGGLNIDGVGVEANSPEVIVQLCCNPHSHPNYTDILLKMIFTELTKESKFRLPWKQVPFLPCSDQIPSDPYFKIPFPLIYQPCPEIWHSSLDTPDKLSPGALKQICLASATYLYFLANAGYKEARALASQIYDEARQDLTTMKRELTKADEKRYLELTERMKYKRERYIQTLSSTTRLVNKNHRKQHILLLANLSEKLRVKFKTKKRRFYSLKVWEKEAASLVPQRIVPGFLTLRTLPKSVKERCRWGPGYQVLVEPIMWIDGKRNLLQIFHLLKQEVGKVDGKDLIRSFKFLERYGYIKIKRRKCLKEKLK